MIAAITHNAFHSIPERMIKVRFNQICWGK